MTDEIKTPEGAQNGAEAKTFTPEETQARIKQLNEEAKAHRLRAEAAEAKLAEQSKAAQAAEEKRLAEQGEFKKLYEAANADLNKVKSEAAKATEYEAVLTELLNKRMAEIPEGSRSLVPEGYTPLQKLKYIEQNAALLTSRQAPNLNPGAGGTSNGKAVVLTAEQIQTAKQFNMTPEQYAKQLLAHGRE